jgi:hypothetical protein
MRTPIFFIITGLGLVVASAPSAGADICFQYGSGGGPLVAKAMALPAPNSCLPLALYENGGREGAANAMICRDAANTLVYHYDYNSCTGPGNYSESATCRLSLTNGNLPTSNPDGHYVCNGQFAGLAPNQVAGAKQFTDNTLVASFCDDGPVPTGSACYGGDIILRRPFAHPEVSESMPPGRPETTGRAR